MLRLKGTKRFFSLLLAFAVLLGTVTSASAAWYVSEYFPSDYVKDIKITTNLAEIARTGNNAVRPTITVEGSPAEVIEDCYIYFAGWYTMYEKDSKYYKNEWVFDDHIFEKGKRYCMAFEVWLPIDSGFKYGFKPGEEVLFDGKKITGAVESRERTYSRYEEKEYYRKAALRFYFEYEMTEDYPLVGSVSYTGDAMYGERLTATNLELVTDIHNYLLKPQWQVREGRRWMNIAGATDHSINLAGRKNLVGKSIRIKYTADGYRDAIYGASKRVEKRDSALLGEPVAPELETYDHGSSYSIDIKNFNDTEQAYYYSISYPGNSAVSTPVEITSNPFSITRTATDQIVEVSTQIKDTDWQMAGNIIRSSKVIVPAKNPGTSVTTLVYPDYSTLTPTIYLAVGETASVKYMISPAGAKSNLPTWKAVATGPKPLVTVSMGKAFGQGEGEGVVNIKAGTNTGTATVTAYKPDGVTPWYYGSDYSNMGRSITVVVYDPKNISTVPANVIRRSLQLNVGESFEMDYQELREIPFASPELDVYWDPDSYDYEIAIEKAIMTGFEYLDYDGSVAVSNYEEGEGGVAIDACNENTNTSKVVIFAVSKEDGSKRKLEEISVKVGSSGTSVGGTVKSFGNDKEEITLRLINGGKTVQEKKLTGNNASYSFDLVAAGDYTIVASKKGHVNANYNVKVGTQAVTQNVEMELYGDANGDNKVDLKDVVLLRQYMANYSYEVEASSVEVESSADANGDGKIDLKDVVLLRQYMANYVYSEQASTVVLGPKK